jgi:hypothetical protein
MSSEGSVNLTVAEFLGGFGIGSAAGSGDVAVQDKEGTNAEIYELNEKVERLEAQMEAYK